MSRGFRKRLVEAIVVNLSIAALLLLAGFIWPHLRSLLDTPAESIIAIIWIVVMIQVPALVYYATVNFEWEGAFRAVLYVIGHAVLATFIAFWTLVTCLVGYWTISATLLDASTVGLAAKLVAIAIFTATLIVGLLTSALAWATYIAGKN